MDWRSLDTAPRGVAVFVAAWDGESWEYAYAFFTGGRWYHDVKGECEVCGVAAWCLPTAPEIARTMEGIA